MNIPQDDREAASLIDEAISYYQDASSYLEQCVREDATLEVQCGLGPAQTGPAVSL